MTSGTIITQQSVLASRTVTEQHTGENTANEIRSLANEFGVYNTQKCAVVTDNASNMMSSVEDLQWEHIQCFARGFSTVFKLGQGTVELGKLTPKMFKLGK